MFIRKNFARASAHGTYGAPRILAYRTADDALAAVRAVSYFDEVADQVEVGDLIYIHASDGFGFAVVNQVADGVVDVTDPTAVGTADTD